MLHRRTSLHAVRTRSRSAPHVGQVLASAAGLRSERQLVMSATSCA